MPRRTSWPLVAFSLLFLVGSGAVAGESNLETSLPAAAGRVCREFTALMDQGQYRETYSLTAPMIQRFETEALWHGRMASERESMGLVRSRRLVQVKKAEGFADLPRGDYLLAVYETAFAAQPEAQEIVVLTPVKEGYGLVGYRIRYNMWPEALHIILNGLLIVFFIMTLLACVTWLISRLVRRFEKPEAKEKE